MHYKNITVTPNATFGYMCSVIIPMTRLLVCGGFPLIGLCVRASFLTNRVLYYNNNFIINIFFNFTLYSAHSRVGRGNLVLI